MRFGYTFSGRLLQNALLLGDAAWLASDPHRRVLFTLFAKSPFADPDQFSAAQSAQFDRLACRSSSFTVLISL